MADLTVSTDIDTFLGSADNAEARTNLGIPSSITPFVISTADSYIGGAGALDGEVTVGQDVPAIYYFKHSTLGWKQYLLRAGTDAESSPDLIRPDDYNGATNTKVFELMN